MSSKIPVVVAAGGGYEQLQPGDTLAATLTPVPGTPAPVEWAFPTRSLDFAAVQAGMVCAVHPSGAGVIRAVAANAQAAGFGLAQQLINPGDNGTVQLGGLFWLLDWTLVVGFRQLISGNAYYLDAAAPGKLTRSPTYRVGDFLQPFGVALTPNHFSLVVGPPVLL